MKQAVENIKPIRLALGNIELIGKAFGNAKPIK